MKPAPPSADSLTGLTPEQRALLMLRIRQRAAGRVSREPALAPVPRPEGGLPLSFAQQRLWFLDQWQPHGWSALAGETEVVPIPGNHVTLIRDPENVRVLAEKIDAALRTTSAAGNRTPPTAPAAATA
jgi:thioesterase domain-containing protein